MKQTVSKPLKIGLVLLIVVLPIIGWMQRWKLYDLYRLRAYDPSPRVAQLATDVTMNEAARRLFYVYHPELNDKSSFNNNCKSSERTIVLGCYVSGQGIYLYSVNDKRLTGVLQVTAAHEMLHAAYERLSQSDKAAVNTLLNAAFKEVTDERIRTTIEDYRKNGADVTNELHSILGTEVRNLPPDLENYYKRYFADRSAVVTYSERYEQAFTERKKKVADSDVRLDQLKKQIDSNESALLAKSHALETEKHRLNALLAAKNYSEYNAGVSGYNAQVNAYNLQVRQVRSLIDEYNAVVAERNAIVLEESELVKAIDSRPNTIPQE